MTTHSHPTATSASESHGDHDHSSVNQTPLFLKVFGALCVLTAVSFAIANSPLMNSKTIGWTLMLGVSCAKAFLVIAFFMHLKWERAWKYALTLPTIAMAIFLVVALVPDIAMRSGLYAESRWRHATEGVVTGAADHQTPHTETPHTDASQPGTSSESATPNAQSPGDGTLPTGEALPVEEPPPAAGEAGE